MKFSDQVATALKDLHPGVRRDIRRALDDIDAGKKRDVHALAREFVGYQRLRVGKYRVILRHDESGELIAEFLAPRATVYRSFRARQTK